MTAPYTEPEAFHFIRLAEYNGTLRTFALTDLPTASDVQKIRSIIRDAGIAAGFHKNVFQVRPNRDIEVSYFMMDEKFPNLFLPAEDRNENNKTSFDNIISYVIYKLSEAGYAYNGLIVADGREKQWKLTVRNGEVFRTDGKWVIMYDEKHEYQVGGMEY